MTDIHVLEQLRDLRVPNPSWSSLIMRAMITQGAVSLNDKVFAAAPMFSDTGQEQMEWGPCDWMPRSDDRLNFLDGPSGGTATAELNGSGRTTLLAGGLQWRLVSLPAGTPITSYTSAGITVVGGDRYVVSFTRPSPDGQYGVEWNVPGFTSPVLESFMVGSAAVMPQRLPQRGDPCRIAFDNARTPFIIWWEPKS